MIVTVYGLVDPREPDRVRYVGVTRDLPRRLAEHRRQLDRGTGAKHAWLRELAAGGVAPVALEMATCRTRGSAWRREWMLIRELREHGLCDLNAPTRAPQSLTDTIADEAVAGESVAETQARFIA